MVLLTYPSTHSPSPGLFLVTFWKLILCQISLYLGSSHGVLIGKRPVGNVNPESEVRFCLISSHLPLLIWKACAPSFAPLLLKQLLFYTLPRVALLSQSPLPALHGSTVCYCPRRLCWNTVVKRGCIAHATQPSSNPFGPTDHDWNGGPSPRALFVFW
jgi:hypothetical protein